MPAVLDIPVPSLGVFQEPMKREKSENDPAYFNSQELQGTERRNSRHRAKQKDFEIVATVHSNPQSWDEETYSCT
jgi:hypothetical protein